MALFGARVIHQVIWERERDPFSLLIYQQAFSACHMHGFLRFVTTKPPSFDAWTSECIHCPPNHFITRWSKKTRCRAMIKLVTFMLTKWNKKRPSVFHRMSISDAWVRFFLLWLYMIMNLIVRCSSLLVPSPSVLFNRARIARIFSKKCHLLRAVFYAPINSDEFVHSLKVGWGGIVCSLSAINGFYGSIYITRATLSFVKLGGFYDFKTDS